jgi:hypothetical protein
LNPTANATLALPPSGVFNFTTVNIPAGVTVQFTRNATNTPVTMLATADVTIAGTIDVSGANGGAYVTGTATQNNGGPGGPGGFDGGAGANGVVSTAGGSGLGPGGGGGGPGPSLSYGGGGGFLTAGGGTGVGAGAGGPAYGTPNLLPLIGGSGGGGGSSNFGSTAGGGGGGGGALLIASSGTITLTGTIRAFGGTSGYPGGAGSGGAVRLVATTITGSTGLIDLRGGIVQAGAAASVGRVRIEAFTNTAAINLVGVPPSAFSSALPSTVTLPNAPTLTITSIAGVAAPASPTASFSIPDITLPAGTANPVTVALAASNIPPGTTVRVTVSGQTGGANSGAAILAGTLAASTASASVTIPTDQPSVISASATFTLTASSGGGPLFVQGEEVERVRVVTNYGGASQVAYLTRSGREVLLLPVR